MPPLRLQKQEKFCLEYFSSGNATEAAIKAGYSPKNARSIGSENLTKTNVKARLLELNERAASKRVMTKQERLERLSEIGRARVSDFVKCENGISRITVGTDSVNSAALQEVVSEEVPLGKGRNAPIVVVTRIKLRDPVVAIAELNKMDGSYAAEKHEVTGKDGKSLEVDLDVKGKLISILNRLASRETEKSGDSKPE